MTKKDSATAQSAETGGGDFFDDISVDLQSQFSEFAGKEESSETKGTDEASTQLFASDSSASLSDLDEAEGSVFDTSSDTPPPQAVQKNHRNHKLLVSLRRAKK